MRNVKTFPQKVHIWRCAMGSSLLMFLLLKAEGLVGLVVSLTLYNEYQPPSPSCHFLPAVLKVCMGSVIRRYGDLMLSTAPAAGSSPSLSPSQLLLALGILNLLHLVCCATCGSSHVPAPSLQAMEQCSYLPLPFHHPALSLGGLGDRDHFQMELGTNQNKPVLQRTVSMGITPGNGRLGVASRRSMKAIVRDQVRCAAFLHGIFLELGGFISSRCLGFGLSILTIQHSAHHIHLS